MNFLNEIVVTEIQEVLTRTWKQGDRLAVASRLSCGFSVVLSGRIVYHENGRDIVSDPSTVIFLPKGASYTWDCEESGQFTVLNFQIAQDYSADGITQIQLHDTDALLYADLLREHKNIQKWSLLAGPTGHAEQMAGIYRIILLLSRRFQNNDNFNILLPSIRYLEENYSDPELSNQLLAEKSHLSEAHFRKLFKEKYGIPPMQYLRQLQINQAKNMLHESDISISEIASRCGFTNVYSFCRSFRSHTGKSPTEYRFESSFE